MDMSPTDSTDGNTATSSLSMLDILFDTRRLRVMTGHPDVKQVASDMIQQYGLEEAFFVCDIGQVIEKHAEWLMHMPRVRPFYAVKCNDSPLVLETLAGLGTGFDVASKVEMHKVLGLGVPPKDLIYANPAKPRSHIKAAAELNVRTVTFDSEAELYKLKAYLPGAKLVVRIRCEAEKAQCPLGMKFGVSVREATDLLNVAKSLDLDVVGVSFHVGSGCRDPPVFMRAIASARLLFDYASQELGYDFNLLDIGGGFPGNNGTSIAEIAEVVNAALERFFPVGCGVEIIAEPGRYYVASAFTLVAQIHSIREVKGEEHRYMYYINDGIYGSFNCLMYDHHVVHPELLQGLNKSGRQYLDEDQHLYECSIWGPTCDGLDQICTSELLPKMNVGEWLAFPDMGAYTLVAGGTFNGFPLPKLATVASPDAWKVLKDFMSSKAFVVQDVQVTLKSVIGCNRDAVGWGFVERAVLASNEAEDGQSTSVASSIASDDESVQESDSSTNEVLIRDVQNSDSDF